jgi:competence CoiA-like predicted nuclease
MKFALIDNNRVEPQPKQQGICPNCSQPVIAKCCKQKIWHWAPHAGASILLTH